VRCRGEEGHVRDEVELSEDRVVFAPVGGRRLRRTGAGVLLAGGAVQLLAGVLAPAWQLLVAGVVAIAFGVAVLRSAQRGTSVTADGWHDPTRVRNEQLAWPELAVVRLVRRGDHAVVALERRGEGIGAAVPVARLPLAQVPAVVATITPWARAADVAVRDLTSV
jgi:hypothetical protein